MSYSRVEFEADLVKRRKQKVKERERDFQQMAQAAVPAAAVTGSAEWDFLLSLIQAEVERLDAVVAALTEAYATEPSFDPIKMSEAKASIQRAVVQRDTLQSIVTLPKEIIEKGEKAQLALQQYADE